MKMLLTVLGVVLGLFLIGRAVVEPFVVDFSNPATYHLDWGGPHLAGVLAVHCGPGLVSAALIALWFRRRLSTRH